MHNLSIFGTSSDAGKSTITFVVAKLLQDLGYRVVPFKAQNVSNNAVACADGREIAVAQYFQAEVLGLTPMYQMNPVLLKSGRKSSAALIVNGQVVETKDVRAYYRDIDRLKPIVNEAYRYLDARYDCVIAEGAGSPVELNLMDKDLSNIHIATEFQTKIILVADIEKGGVFASIWGVYNLLPQALRERVIGVVVNKFRGDRSLFDEGVRIIEQEFGIPVLGVLPYAPFNLGFEDSQSLINYQQKSQAGAKRIGVIAYPTMSNYNDFEPLITDEGVMVEFVRENISLKAFDLVILPGSKLVIEDLSWLKSTGLFAQLQSHKGEILGICGGFEMMFRQIVDLEGVESESPARVAGLGFVDDEIIFRQEKVVRRGHYKLFGREVEGFEIHHGWSKRYPLYYEKEKIRGTFVHGLFNDETFRDYKEQAVDAFVAQMKEHLDMERILQALR